MHSIIIITSCLAHSKFKCTWHVSERDMYVSRMVRTRNGTYQVILCIWPQMGHATHLTFWIRQSYRISTCFIWHTDVPYRGTWYVPHACPRGAGPWTGYIGAERSSCEVACPPPWPAGPCRASWCPDCRSSRRHWSPGRRRPPPQSWAASLTSLRLSIMQAIKLSTNQFHVSLYVEFTGMKPDIERLRDKWKKYWRCCIRLFLPAACSRHITTPSTSDFIALSAQH